MEEISHHDLITILDLIEIRDRFFFYRDVEESEKIKDKNETISSYFNSTSLKSFKEKTFSKLEKEIIHRIDQEVNLLHKEDKNS